MSSSMKQGNSKTMTQGRQLDAGHRTNKSVNDQCSDEASTSSLNSAKNSRKKISQPPPKMQQADRKIKQQSNKSAIRKTSASAKAKIPIVNRECLIRDKSGPSQRSTVGNQSERVSVAVDDKASDPDMTIITQHNNVDLRDSIPSDVVDNTKNVSGTVNCTCLKSELDSSLDFQASEKIATVINTDLKDDGATSGISPTNENNNSVASKNDAAQDHLNVLNENQGSPADDNKEGLHTLSNSTKTESCVKPLPKTDDPIARLNALRANISNALKEVKAVLDQHAPEQSVITDENGSTTGEDGCVQFRFVRRVRKKSVIKFDDEEIVCGSSGETPETGSNSLSENTSEGQKTKDKERDTIISSQIEPPSAESSQRLTKVNDTLTHETDPLESPQDELPGEDGKPEVDSTSEPIDRKIDSDVENLTKSLTSSAAHHDENADQNSELIKSQNITVAQEPSKIVEQSDERTPDLLTPAHEKQRKQTIKSNAKNTNKKEKALKKIGSSEQKVTEQVPSNSSETKQSKKFAKQAAESKIPISKKPPQTINKKLKDTPQNSTEPANASKNYKITSRISNADGNINKPDQNMTDLKLEQKTSVDVVKDIQERDEQTEKTIVDSNNDLNRVTKLDNTEDDDIIPQSSDALAILKETQVKKPVQKFANVEASKESNFTSKESKADKTKNENSPFLDSIQFETLTENMPPPQTASADLPKSSSILSEDSQKPQKQPDTEKLEKISVKGDTQAAIENTTSKNITQMSVLEKDMSTKPPVKLRAKRGSLADSAKTTPKEKTFKPKRASIGSERELIKITTENQLAEAKKDIVAKKTSSFVNKPYSEYETSTSSVTTSVIENAPTNKVPNSTAPIKAVAINSSDCAQSESPAKNNATLKVSPSSLVDSNSESLTEITPIPLNVSTATITQPIPSESNDANPEKSTILSENDLDVANPLNSTPDKLVSSESAGRICNTSVTESIPKMTVVKKDIVPSITPKQSFDELSEKVKHSDILNESLNNNLVEFQRIGDDRTTSSPVNTKEVHLPAKSDQSIGQNGEVTPCAVEKTSPVHKSESVSKVQSTEPPEAPQSQCEKIWEIAETNSRKTEPAISPSIKKDLPHKPKLRKLQKQNSICEDTPEIVAEVIDGKITTQDITPQDIDAASIGNATPIQEKQDISLDNECTSTSTDVPIAGEITSQQTEPLPSTTTESSLSESEKDAAKSPAAKKMKKMKKVVIKRIKRKLSKEGSLDEKVEPEVCEKPIAEPPSDEALEETPETVASEGEAPEEPVEEEPPLPKGPRSCLVKRAYSPGQVVMYADRVRKIVKWKRAVILEKITDISYKLEFDGQEKPAHISCIKKYTDKKVQFGGKEYLEIDYQQEYESSSEEEEYNIWARV